MLNGEVFRVHGVGPGTTIAQLKEKLEKESKVPRGKQRLFCGGFCVESGKGPAPTTLASFGLKGNEHLQLMVALLSVAEFGALDRAVFDLGWDYPIKGTDYLDGSCLMYARDAFVGLLDYSNKQLAGGTHSGDKPRQNGSGCDHRIVITTAQLPPAVNLLFFTLRYLTTSAWNSPTIAAYPNPTVAIRDSTGKVLATYDIRRAAQHQAVVMCCLCRRGSGWEPLAPEALSRGNAMNYTPLQATIVALIRTHPALQ